MFIRIVSLALLVSVLSGCASGLKRTQTPESGRYTVVVLHSDKINLHHSGFAEYVWITGAKHGIRERYKEAVVEALGEYRDYDFVPVDYSSLERFHDPEAYDWEFSAYNANYKQDHEQLQARLPGFLRENDLDLAILIREVSMPNTDTGSYAIMQGAGASFTTFPAQLTVFSNYELQVVDAATGLSEFWRGRIYKILDDAHAIDLEKDVRPDPAMVKEVVGRVEAIIDAKSLKQPLCRLGLIPVPSNVPQNYVVKLCGKMFPLYPHKVSAK